MWEQGGSNANDFQSLGHGKFIIPGAKEREIREGNMVIPPEGISSPDLPILLRR